MRGECCEEVLDPKLRLGKEVWKLCFPISKRSFGAMVPKQSLGTKYGNQVSVVECCR